MQPGAGIRVLSEHPQAHGHGLRVRPLQGPTRVGLFRAGAGAEGTPLLRGPGNAAQLGDKRGLCGFTSDIKCLQ